ncbi:MAG: FkbM family methyltransferase [Candidatus Micrarchaeota archaeon]|nr:FkbM family methyltransferase [Candidatus Micrarchaeota archaeon]
MNINILITNFHKHGIKNTVTLYLNAVQYKIRIFATQSYSQKGEDLIIDKILGHCSNGFYIDVGAHHPSLGSNTKRFYNRGWHGINIEPNPNSYREFLVNRTRDINLNIAIGKMCGELNFYICDADALCTLQKDIADGYLKKGHRILEVKKVQVNTLKNVLSRYASNQKIDFLSVDAEGTDLEVLQSNDWKTFRPKIICIESITYNEGKEIGEIKEFLESCSYERVYFNGLNAIYQDRSV